VNRWISQWFPWLYIQYVVQEKRLLWWIENCIEKRSAGRVFPNIFWGIWSSWNKYISNQSASLNLIYFQVLWNHCSKQRRERSINLWKFITVVSFRSVFCLMNKCITKCAFPILNSTDFHFPWSANVSELNRKRPRPPAFCNFLFCPSAKFLN
jgi:hypothetical protein